MQKEYMRFGEHFTHEIGRQANSHGVGVTQTPAEPQEHVAVEDVPEPPPRSK